jgi:hypothetical protein
MPEREKGRPRSLSLFHKTSLNRPVMSGLTSRAGPARQLISASHLVWRSRTGPGDAAVSIRHNALDDGGNRMRIGIKVPFSLPSRLA